MPPASLHHQILDNLATAVLLIETDMRVAYINPSAEVLLQASNKSIQGQHLTELFHEPGKTIHKLEEASLEQASFSKREAELELVSGRHITVDYFVSPMSDGMLIMELQPLDRFLRISREENMLSTEMSNRALLRGLAHEVKNPLGGVRGAAQLLDRALSDESLRDYTKVIIDEADRLRTLVDSMLGPTKPVELAPVNVHQVLERVRQLCEADASQSIDIVRDYDPSIPELIGDSESLIQAVMNIVSNAVRALSDPQIKSPKIILRTRARRKFTIGARYHKLVARVEIIDNGPGIEPALLPDIFLPMISGRPDGSGLGLSIAQSIISRHHGLIECDSQPGRTRFTINLPLSRAEKQSPVSDKKDSRT